jgi:hypothetical protein
MSYSRRCADAAAAEQGQPAEKLCRQGDLLLLIQAENETDMPSDLLSSTKSRFNASLATKTEADAIEFGHVNSTVTHKGDQPQQLKVEKKSPKSLIPQVVWQALR